MFSLQVIILLCVHGFMMSPLVKATVKFCPANQLFKSKFY